ncbi:MAG: hypothetical protein LBR79_03785 [Oscillospiraceae bacterium]|jgi:hypothetical protein|nr:hypothetical protein [Oscillospiraceae bacterium]
MTENLNKEVLNMRKEIEKLLEDKDFAEKLLKLEEQSEVKELFATEGGLKDVTDDEVEELGQKLGELMQRVASLPEDELKDVGGGTVGGFIKEHGKRLAMGAAALAALAAAGFGTYKVGKSKHWWGDDDGDQGQSQVYTIT